MEHGARDGIRMVDMDMTMKHPARLEDLEKPAKCLEASVATVRFILDLVRRRVGDEHIQIAPEACPV